MKGPNHFRSFAEFEREIIRPGRRVGLTVEDILEAGQFEREFDFHKDPWEEMLAESDEEDDY
ncbi:MAG: transcriptional regulator [Polyangiaceae bacterium]